MCSSDLPAPAINLKTHLSTDRGQPALKGERRAFFPEAQGYLATPVYERRLLQPGETLTGPVIVEERESTLVVGPGARLEVDEFGSLIVEPSREARAEVSTGVTTEA